jgi:small subunit ribosomal protein S5
MAKTTNDDRRQNRRAPREEKEFGEHVLEVRRVTRVVKGGRRMRFRATVIIGNHKGKVGIGTGKSGEVRTAVEKAVSQARKHMFVVPITAAGSIPHDVELKFKAAHIRLIPAADGTGIIAGGALRPVLLLAGVRNILSKRFGSSNTLVNAQATMRALRKLRPVRTVVRPPAAVVEAE